MLTWYYIEWSLSLSSLEILDLTAECFLFLLPNFCINEVFVCPSYWDTCCVFPCF